MRVIQVGVADWLTVDEVLRPVCLIHYGPAVWRATGETLMVYRVDRWTLRRQDRWVLGRFDDLAAALECAREAHEDARPKPYEPAPYREPEPGHPWFTALRAGPGGSDRAPP